MICSFRGKATEVVWYGLRPRGLEPDTARRVLAKLDALDSAAQLSDLRVPPGNRLEKLQGDRAGQHSIRVNRQWRPCFIWTEHGAEQVELVDYH